MKRAVEAILVTSLARHPAAAAAQAAACPDGEDVRSSVLAYLTAMYEPRFEDV